MLDLAAELAEYCRNVERKPTKPLELFDNIMRDARATKQWPIATLTQWEAALEQACKRGLLTKTSETIWVPLVVAEVKPKQMELFDE